jgi:ketosteroid isomerase-like protein
MEREARRVEREVLDANQAFYEAFRSKDPDQMSAIWADDCDVAVVHPGWPCVHGRLGVLDSWRGILEAAAPPEITCSDPRVYAMGDSAFVICTEHLLDGDLVATNIFVRERGNWKVVHHQATPQPSVDLTTRPERMQ